MATLYADINAQPDWQQPTGVATSASKSGPRPTKFVAGIFFLGALAGTTATVPFGDVQHQLLATVASGQKTLHGEAPSTDDSESPRTDSELVRWIKDNSGLTWDQVARIFGVSRRAVHLWANGGRVNAHNAEALREFAAIVRSVPADSGERTRDALLAIGDGGRSLVDTFRNRHFQQAKNISGTPFTPSELLGTSTDADS